MSNVDYVKAYHERAIPAFRTIEAEVRPLLEMTAKEAAGLHQNRVLGMDWPEDGKLHDAFGMMNLETLALASCAVYFAGHWRPRGAHDVLGSNACPGLAWKFSLYADQNLADRLNIPQAWIHEGPGLSLRCHQGVLRVCYSSSHMWTWAEVAPATPDGYTFAANVAMPALRKGWQGINRSWINRRDAAAWDAFENFNANGKLAGFPPGAWLTMMGA